MNEKEKDYVILLLKQNRLLLSCVEFSYDNEIVNVLECLKAIQIKSLETLKEITKSKNGIEELQVKTFEILKNKDINDT